MTTLTALWPFLALVTLLFAAGCAVVLRSRYVENAEQRGIRKGREDLRRPR